MPAAGPGIAIRSKAGIQQAVEQVGPDFHREV